VALLGIVVVISEIETTVNVAVGAVKGDAGRARQIGSQNSYGRPHYAGSRCASTNRAQTYRQAEDRAVIVCPSVGCRPIQTPIGILEKLPGRVLAIRASTLRAQAVKYGQRTGLWLF